MANVILGSTSSVEAYREEVSPHDPGLGEAWETARAAGLVHADDAGPSDPAMMAARLSGVTRFRPLTGNRECHIVTSDDPITALREITDGGGVVAHHFADGTAPVWVESDYPALAELIAHKYGCPVGRPDDWSVEA